MAADVVVTALRVEHQDGAPLSVATDAPRLSWQAVTTTPDWRQAAWEVEAVGANREPLWQSGRVEGRESVLVAWGGAPLASRTRCDWRVRVWGEDGSHSEWSASANFAVGLLRPEDWSADVIAPAWPAAETTAGERCPHFRKTFTLDAVPAHATLHITALGIYDALLNGEKIGDHFLAPGWTVYESRLHVQTFDVAAQLRVGENVLDIEVADGWWRGNLGFAGNRDIYGNRTGVLAQLECDGAVIATDTSWLVAPGAVLDADLYDGETYDARVDPSDWQPVTTLDFDKSVLVPQPTPPVRVTEVVRPVAITTSPAGKTIVDFGQNLVGVVRIRPHGPAGTEITLRHAEILEDGELCTRILREAKATDTYTTRGTEGEEWHARFTSHGFRYAEVTGWSGDLALTDLDALVMHSDMRRTGWFDCSHDLVNQLHKNIVWGWRGNTVSLPTDCPQRDERLGWTGDIQAFTPTASFIYDAVGFLDGWLADLAAEQLPDGRVPAVIPNVLRNANAYAAGWGDAATVVPTVLHEWFGDLALLERQLESMRAWVDSIAARAGDDLLWDHDFQFGDWVDPTVDPNTPGAARTDSAFIATAYFAHSADLVAGAASVLGRDDIAQQYAALAANVRDAIRQQWVAPSGRVVADTQAGCAIALAFDLVEPHHRDIVGNRLRDLVRNERYRLTTGFLGTPVLNAALTQAGHIDSAYRLLLETTPPSWLYPVTAGATTIWERWDALQADGTLNKGSGMLSFNHYALGAVGAWLHETVGGLAALSPGFARFRFAPEPGPGIEWAALAFDSQYGRITTRWELAGCGIELHLTVPPNTEAEVTLPGRDEPPRIVGSGDHHWRYPIDTATYWRWTGARAFGLTTLLRDLQVNEEAWAAVAQFAPEFGEQFAARDGHRAFSQAAQMFGVPEEARNAIVAELSSIGPPVPESPAAIGV